MRSDTACPSSDRFSLSNAFRRHFLLRAQGYPRRNGPADTRLPLGPLQIRTLTSQELGRCHFGASPAGRLPSKENQKRLLLPGKPLCRPGCRKSVVQAQCKRSCSHSLLDCPCNGLPSACKQPSIANDRCSSPMQNVMYIWHDFISWPRWRPRVPKGGAPQLMPLGQKQEITVLAFQPIAKQPHRMAIRCDVCKALNRSQQVKHVVPSVTLAGAIWKTRHEVGPR